MLYVCIYIYAYNGFATPRHHACIVLLNISLIEEMKPCLGRVIVGFEGFQIDEKLGLDGREIMKIRCLEGLGVALGAFWQSLAKLWLGILRKLSPGEAQDRLRERQVGARAA